MIWTIGGHDQSTAIYRTIFSFLFFSCILPNKDYVSGDLKTWTVDVADAVGEGCLGRSVPSLGAGLVMSPLKVWFKAPVVNRSHSAEVSGCCVRPLEPNEPSALTNLPLLEQRCTLFPWSTISHLVSCDPPRASGKAAMAIGVVLKHGKGG